jgi:hypothetical protein
LEGAVASDHCDLRVVPDHRLYIGKEGYPLAVLGEVPLVRLGDFGPRL